MLKVFAQWLQQRRSSDHNSSTFFWNRQAKNLKINVICYLVYLIVDEKYQHRIVILDCNQQSCNSWAHWILSPYHNTSHWLKFLHRHSHSHVPIKTVHITCLHSKNKIELICLSKFVLNVNSDCSFSHV